MVTTNSMYYRYFISLGFVWKFIGEWNRMERNDHKEMKMNEMYLSKGNKWKRMEWNGIK